MAGVSLPQFPEFDVNEQASLSPRWSKWLDRFENFLLALNITDPSRRKAMLLHYSGEGVYEIFSSLTLAVAAEGVNEYDHAKSALNDYFSPKKKMLTTRCMFFTKQDKIQVNLLILTTLV